MSSYSIMCVPVATQRANINSHLRASLDPMTHIGLGASRLNRDKSALITWIFVIPMSRIQDVSQALCYQECVVSRM